MTSTLSHRTMPTTTSSSSGSDADEPITYTTTAADAPAAPRATLQKKDWRPKATIHLRKMAERTFAEKICSLAFPPESLHEVKDIDRGPMPQTECVKDVLWIVSHAIWPVALQWFSYTFFPQYQWPIWVAYPIYLVGFGSFLLMVVERLNESAVRLGTFSEKFIGRDRMPDDAARQLARAITIAPVLRTAGAFWFYYDKSQGPSFGWTFPLRMAAYMLCIDYFFYCYHRSCHEFDFLWFIHQRHHVTRHPIPILSIIADDYQEIIEIAIVPFLATAIVPMTFSELYITLTFCVFTEIGGHSGVRAAWGHPLLHHVLRPLGMDLMIEDHELHHANGKSGKAYGKHTQVWDKMFGTKGVRRETLGCS